MLKQLKINRHLVTGLLTVLILGMIVSLTQASVVKVEIDDNPPPRKFAVLIAIDHYPDEKVRSLKYCKSDTLALKEALIAGGFREEDIFLMTDDARRINLLPIKENIRRILATLEELTKEGDMIFFFFSGYSGSSQDNDVYLMTVDSVTKDHLNVPDESHSDSPFMKYLLEGLAQEDEQVVDSEIEEDQSFIFELPEVLDIPMDENLQRSLEELAEEDEPTVDSEIKKDKRFVLLIDPQNYQLDMPALQVLGNDKVTKENVRKAFEELLKEKKDDGIIIHLHGRGHHVNDNLPVLLSTDSEVGEDQSNRLYVQEVLDTLGRSKAKSRIIAFDSCFSATSNTLSLPKNTALLLAARPGFLAYESREIQGSYFTHFMTRGLLGEADKNGDNNGTVDLTELFHYVKTQLAGVKEFKMFPSFMVNGDILDLGIVRLQNSEPEYVK